jgi:hypothetical protein
MRTLAAAVVLSVSLLGWSPQSYAKGRTESPENAAKKACAAGNFRKGVEILADLYVRTDDATYVFNQGRCYEQNHQWVSAIDRFREYLRKGKRLPASVAAEAEKHIADCKVLLDEENARNAPPPQPTPVLAPVAVPRPEAPPAPQPTPPPPSPATSPGGALRTTGLVIGGVGIAGLATAVALNLKANSLADEANKTHDPATKSSQQSYKTGAIICYGVGAASLVTGTTLYLIGRSKGKTGTSDLAILPLWSPNQAGLAVRGEF